MRWEDDFYYLTIKDAKESDSGKYRITARSPAGEEVYYEIEVVVTTTTITPM